MARSLKIHGSYTRRKIKALSERGKRMAAARWKLDQERRDAEMPERIREIKETEIQNLPRKQGDALGCLQWHDFRTGKVRRWTVRIGDRIDRVSRFTRQTPARPAPTAGLG